MHRGPTVEVDLESLRHNIGLIRRKVGRLPIFAVVKADAYGHGAVEVSRELIISGIDTLVVAYTSEAVQLRDAGIKGNIIVLFDHEVSGDTIRYGLTPVINDLETARALSMLAVKRQRRVNVHLNIDTGMGRLGFRYEDFPALADGIITLKGISVTGLMSHFSEADISDRRFAELQMERFFRIRSLLKNCGIVPSCHIANSAAVVTLPGSHLDAVRPGLLVYGCNPYSPDMVRPVMSVKTSVLSVRRLRKGVSVSYGRTFITRRESTVAVLPIGYADGFSRALSNNSEVIIRGRRAPVIGRVCMDIVMVDVTSIKGVRALDEVVIMGRQGRESITADEIARNAGTIPYEVFTSLGSCGRRVYTGRGN